MKRLLLALMLLTALAFSQGLLSIPGGDSGGAISAIGERVRIPGGLALTFGTVDAFMDFAGTAAGTTVTAANLATGTIGASNMSGWGLSTSPLTSMKFAASQAACGGQGGSVTVNGILYPVSHVSQSISHDDSDATQQTASAFFSPIPSGGVPILVINGCIVLGPPNVNPSGFLFDYLPVYNFLGHFAALQLNNGNGPGGCYCVNIEADNGGTVHSPYQPVPPLSAIRFSFKVDFTAARLASLNLYDSTFHQIGSTITLALGASANINEVRHGNNQTGTAATISFFQYLMFDYTNHLWPNIPHPPIG